MTHITNTGSNGRSPTTPNRTGSDTRGPPGDAVISAYERKVDRFYELSGRIAALEAEVSRGELADREDYARLRSRRGTLRADLDAMVESFNEHEVISVFETLGSAPATS